MRTPRAVIVLVFACLLAVLAVSGGVDGVLTALPLMALAAMLLSGRYVGEAQILRRREDAFPARCRRTKTLRPPRLARVRSVSARTLVTRRGPPGAALA